MKTPLFPKGSLPTKRWRSDGLIRCACGSSDIEVTDYEADAEGYCKRLVECRGCSVQTAYRVATQQALESQIRRGYR